MVDVLTVLVMSTRSFRPSRQILILTDGSLRAASASTYRTSQNLPKAGGGGSRRGNRREKYGKGNTIIFAYKSFKSFEKPGQVLCDDHTYYSLGIVLVT